MDVITIYMTTLAGVLFSRRLFFFARRVLGVPSVRQSSLLFWWPRLDFAVCRWLTYCRVIHRHSFTEPWTVVELLVLATYIAANVAIVVIYQTTQRDGLAPLFAVNMVPLYFGHRHDFPAWVLRLPLRVYARFHRVVALTSVTLAAVHAGMSWKHPNTANPANNWTWILLVRRIYDVLALLSP